MILAGGLGKCLRQLPLDKPKPIISISSKPVVKDQLVMLHR